MKRGEKVLEERESSQKLYLIKNHLDAHGIGCAVLGDHVAVNIGADRISGAGLASEVRRLKSFDEARQVIGCTCDELK